MCHLSRLKTISVSLIVAILLMCPAMAQERPASAATSRPAGGVTKTTKTITETITKTTTYEVPVAEAEGAMSENAAPSDGNSVPEEAVSEDDAISSPETLETPPADETTMEAIPVNMLHTAIPATDLTARDYLAVALKPIDGIGKYQGMQVMMTNKQPNHIQVIQAEIVNGINQATAEVKSGKTRKRLGNLLRGVMMAGMFAVPYVTPMGDSDVGYIGTAFAQQAAVGMMDSQMMMPPVDQQPVPTQDVESQYVRNIHSQVIRPGDTFSFSSLVPKGATPHLNITFKDLKTGQIYDMSL